MLTVTLELYASAEEVVDRLGPQHRDVQAETIEDAIEEAFRLYPWADTVKVLAAVASRQQWTRMKARD